MKTYIGTKQITAPAMTRAEYNAYRGWTLPSAEDGADAGYLVEYLDGGKPNDQRHTGYISWSPKEQFDNAYRPVDGMSFGLAIEALKQGKRVARAGWNGKGMWLFIRPVQEVNIRTVVEKVQTMPQSVKAYFDAKDDRTNPGEFGLGTVKFSAYICMLAADGSVVNGWLASQTDMLADDWAIV